MQKTFRAFGLAAIIVAVVFESPAYAQWEHYGLETRNVQSVESFSNYLFACTDSGLYRIPKGGPATSWQLLGLAGLPTKTFAGLQASTMLVGLSSGSGLIRRSSDYGVSWHVAGSGFGGSDPSTVARIDATPNLPNVRFYQLACGGGDVGKSTNLGGSFVPTLGDWGFIGGFNFVKIDSIHYSVAYTGGMSALSGPLLMKTADTGKTWSLLMEGYAAPSDPAHDIAISPNSPDTVWVAFERCIGKSGDGGYHWTSYCPPSGFHFRTIEVDQRRPEYLYASGGQNPGPLTLYYSHDGGATWQSVADTVQLVGPVRDITLLAVDSVTNRIYFATEKGVLTFTDTVPASDCCVGVTGNVNNMGTVDLTDLSWLIRYFIEDELILPCEKEGDINASGNIDLSDLSALIMFLIGDGYSLPNCP